MTPAGRAARRAGPILIAAWLPLAAIAQQAGTAQQKAPEKDTAQAQAAAAAPAGDASAQAAPAGGANGQAAPAGGANGQSAGGAAPAAAPGTGGKPGAAAPAGGEGGAGAAPRPPAAVTVRTLQPQTVQLTTTLPGRVVASATAEVRPQVAGIITERLFEEGAAVTAGDPLFKIDPATYDAAVAQAQASVSQAQAQLDNALKTAKRVDQLLSRNVASDSAAEQADADRAIATANLQAALATLKSAQIEQDRTLIRARLTGEIGRSLTSRGALVTAAQADPLAVIRAIDPVYVDVTQSAADLLDFRRKQHEASPDRDTAVTLTLADGTTFGQTGTLTAAEPEVNEQTGVVLLRMKFPNPEKLLLPGMYVQVEMPTSRVEGAYLVPQQAVARDRKGEATALVVGAQDKVESRVLDVVQDRGADWIVSGGLNPGDRVVVDGLQKAAPGATVAPQEEAPADAGAPGSAADPSAAAPAATASAADAAAPAAKPASDAGPAAD